MLVYTGTFHVAVYQVHESMDAMVAAARELGGFIATQGDDVLVFRVPAGRFDCVEVQLKTSRPAGEPSDDEGFQGLFGIHGTIQIWFEATTGVPVLISGTLPVPILGDLDVRVQLKKATGAPSAFKPAD